MGVLRFSDDYVHSDLKQGEKIINRKSERKGNNVIETIYTNMRSVQHSYYDPQGGGGGGGGGSGGTVSPPEPPKPFQGHAVFDDGHTMNLNQGESITSKDNYRIEDNRIVQDIKTNTGRTISHPIYSVPVSQYTDPDEKVVRYGSHTEDGRLNIDVYTTKKTISVPVGKISKPEPQEPIIKYKEPAPRKLTQAELIYELKGESQKLKGGFTRAKPYSPAEEIIERGKGYMILGQAASLQRKGKIQESKLKLLEMGRQVKSGGMQEEFLPMGGQAFDFGTGLKKIPSPPQPQEMKDILLPSIGAYKEPTQKELSERKELLKKEYEVDIGKEAIGGFLEYAGATAIFSGAEAAYTGGASLPTMPAVIIGGGIAGGILRPLGEIAEKEYLKAVRPREAEFIYGKERFKGLDPFFIGYKQFTERHIGAELTEEQRGEYLGVGVEFAGIGGLMLAPRVAGKATAKITEKLPKITEKIEARLLKEAPSYRFPSEPSRMPVKIEPYSDPLFFITKPKGVIEETKIYRILGKDVTKKSKFIYSLKGKGITSPTKKAGEVIDPFEKKLIREVELIPQQPLIKGTAGRAAIAKQEYIPQTTKFMGKVKVTPENFLNKIVVEKGKPRMVSRLFEGKPSVLKPKPREMYVGGMEVSKVTKPAKSVLSYELPKEQYFELLGQKGEFRLRTGEGYIGRGEFDRSLKQRIIPRPKGIRFKGEARTGLKAEVFREEDLSKVIKPEFKLFGEPKRVQRLLETSTKKYKFKEFFAEPEQQRIIKYFSKRYDVPEDILGMEFKKTYFKRLPRSKALKGTKGEFYTGEPSEIRISLGLSEKDLSQTAIHELTHKVQKIKGTIGKGKFEYLLQPREIQARVSQTEFFLSEPKPFFTIDVPSSKAVIKGYAETSKDFIKKFPKSKQGTKSFQRGMREYQASILRQNIEKDLQRELSELGFKQDIAIGIRTGKMKAVKGKTVTPSKGITSSFFVQPLSRMKPLHFEVYEESMLAPLIPERGISSRLFQPVTEKRAIKLFQPLRLKELQGEKFKPAQMTGLNVRTDLLPREKTSEAASMKSIQAERIIPREIITPKQSIKTIQGSLERMFTPQAAKTSLKTPFPSFTPFPPPPPPKFLLGIPIIFGGLDVGTGKERTEGYDAYAKHKGKFIKLNKKALPRKEALGLGGRVVDETTSAQFNIRKSKQKVKPSMKLFSEWDVLSSKFRPRIRGKRYVNEPNTFIERNLFRIDSQGEFEGITVKGWKAKKRKRNSFNLFF